MAVLSNIKTNLLSFLLSLKNNQRYLLQEAISDQHRDLKAIHATSINTIRLVTVYDVNSNDVVVLGCLLRIYRFQTKTQLTIAKIDKILDTGCGSPVFFLVCD